MGRNKDRVFVSVYFRQNISRTEEGRQLGYARFHWGIWVQSKDSHGSGHMLEAVEQDVYANMPGSGGWTFEYRSTDWSRSGGLIQRILIGKLPSGVGSEQVCKLLQAVPQPRPGVVPVENCVSWTEQAMAQLQAKGWADNFAVRQFMDFALKTTADMVDNGIYPSEKGVQNYTSRPFEEKE